MWRRPGRLSGSVSKKTRPSDNSWQKPNIKQPKQPKNAAGRVSKQRVPKGEKGLKVPKMRLPQAHAAHPRVGKIPQTMVAMAGLIDGNRWKIGPLTLMAGRIAKVG